jgi:predicted PhzF superfamily epimerase YddE/YHI9
LRRRWRFVFQSPAAKRFGAITARSSAGRRGAEEVAALQGQIQALQIELENPSHALALVRPRRDRPRCRAAEQRVELAASPLQADDCAFAVSTATVTAKMPTLAIPVRARIRIINVVPLPLKHPRHLRGVGGKSRPVVTSGGSGRLRASRLA